MAAGEAMRARGCGWMLAGVNPDDIGAFYTREMPRLVVFVKTTVGGLDWHAAADVADGVRAGAAPVGGAEPAGGVRCAAPGSMGQGRRPDHPRRVQDEGIPAGRERSGDAGDGQHAFRACRRTGARQRVRHQAPGHDRGHDPSASGAAGRHRVAVYPAQRAGPGHRPPAGDLAGPVGQADGPVCPAARHANRCDGSAGQAGAFGCDGRCARRHPGIIRRAGARFSGLWPSQQWHVG